MAEIAIGLIGAGVIGRAHITGALAQSAAAQGMKICGIADPSPACSISPVSRCGLKTRRFEP
jgi:predicted homoserine dehydrogenase-like protein